MEGCIVSVLLAGCHITTPPGVEGERFKVGITTHTGCPVQHKLDSGGSIQRPMTAKVEVSINHVLHHR